MNWLRIMLCLAVAMAGCTLTTRDGEALSLHEVILHRLEDEARSDGAIGKIYCRVRIHDVVIRHGKARVFTTETCATYVAEDGQLREAYGALHRAAWLMHLGDDVQIDEHRIPPEQAVTDEELFPGFPHALVRRLFADDSADGGEEMQRDIRAEAKRDLGLPSTAEVVE